MLAGAVSFFYARREGLGHDGAGDRNFPFRGIRVLVFSSMIPMFPGWRRTDALVGGFLKDSVDSVKKRVYSCCLEGMFGREDDFFFVSL